MKSTTQLVAIIDIGSTAIRLSVLETGPHNEYKRVDRAHLPVHLGRDVFISGSIQPHTVLQVIENLQRFVELCAGWQIRAEEIHAVATSAVREARNREIFVDRIKNCCNISVGILDGLEETQLTYIAVSHAMQSIHKNWITANSLIMEVGGGTTEIMIMQRGKMKTVLNAKIGTIRLEEQLKAKRDIHRIIQDSLQPSMQSLSRDIDLHSIRSFIILGGDARLAASHIGTATSAELSTIKRSVFLNWVDKLCTLDIDEIVHKLGTSYIRVEGLLPALLIYKLILQETAVEELIVPQVSMREGLLLRKYADRVEFDSAFSTQVLASAQSLRTRYRVHEDKMLTHICLGLFAVLGEQHGLSKQDCIYLEISSILHSVGSYINQSGYHKHGQYIIENSEIFGLTASEVNIVSQIVRYQRGTVPSTESPNIRHLQLSERLVVIKLSAILRLALVLSSLKYSGGPRMVLQADSSGSAFAGRGMRLVISQLAEDTRKISRGIAPGFFHEVFGYKVEFSQ